MALRTVAMMAGSHPRILWVPIEENLKARPIAASRTHSFGTKWPTLLPPRLLQPSAPLGRMVRKLLDGLAFRFSSMGTHKILGWEPAINGYPCEVPFVHPVCYKGLCDGEPSSATAGI